MKRSKLLKALLGGIIFLSGLFFILGCQDNEPTYYLEKQNKIKPALEAPSEARVQNDSRQGQSPNQRVILPFEYSVPEAWQELSTAKSGGMRARTFLTADSLECTFVLLEGQGGGLMQNLERWAKQIGLQPNPQDMVVFRSTSKVWETQSQWKAEFFDFRKLDQSALETILAVVIPLDNQTLFVKMKGLSAPLAGELPALKSLISSIQPHTKSLNGEGI